MYVTSHNWDHQKGLPTARACSIPRQSNGIGALWSSCQWITRSVTWLPDSNHERWCCARNRGGGSDPNRICVASTRVIFFWWVIDIVTAFMGNRSLRQSEIRRIFHGQDQVSLKKWLTTCDLTYSLYLIEWVTQAHRSSSLIYSKKGLCHKQKGAWH
jgi:hypothetical protein